MKRLYTWLLSHKRWIALTAVGVILLTVVFLAVGWLIGFRKQVLILFVLVWVQRVGLGFGAGYAAIRLWPSRHNPLIKWLGLYIHGFIIEVVTAVILLFMTRGVTLTWKFTTVMFVSALASDWIRAPLIIFLIRGPSALQLPDEVEKSGDQHPDFWLTEFRKIVREEVRRARRVTKASLSSGRKPPRK